MRTLPMIYADVLKHQQPFHAHWQHEVLDW
jgi:hypothetical protein